MNDKELLDWLATHPRAVADLDNWLEEGWKWYDRRGAAEANHKGWTHAESFREAVNKLSEAMRDSSWTDYRQ